MASLREGTCDQAAIAAGAPARQRAAAAATRLPSAWAVARSPALGVTSGLSCAACAIAPMKLPRRFSTSVAAHVEYHLTPLGASLGPALTPLFEWIEMRFGDVLAARSDFAGREAA